MGIKSRNITTLSGTFYLDIDVPNSNGNFDILDFGQIKYEFDIIPSDKSKPYIGCMPGAMTVKAHDQLDTGESMFDVIENAIGTYSLETFVTTPTAPVNVVLFDQGDDNIANAYRFPFSLSFQDLTLNEKASHLTMRLSPRRTNLTPQEWETSFITRNAQANATRFGYKYPTNALVGEEYINVTTFNAYPVGDVIHDVVSQLDTGVGNTTLFDVTFLSMGYGDAFGGISENLLNSFATKFVPGNIYTWPTKTLLDEQRNTWNIAFGSYTIAPMFITKISNEPLDQDMVEKLGNGNTIYDKMSTFAGLDGAIFGSAFGINFYLNRRTNVYNVELSNNDIEELSFQSTPRDIDTVQIGTTATNSAEVYEKLFESNSQDNALAYFPVTPNQAIAYEAWKGSPDTVALDFKSFFPNLGVGVLQQDGNAQLISNGTAYYFDISNTGTTPIARNFARDQIWADQVFNSAFVSYAAALGISLTNTAKYRVSTTIYGIDKVKPHEMIAFDSTTPPRYQGKFFRPTSVEYDLKACKTKITAYQVGEYTPILPPIPTEPLPPPIDCTDNTVPTYDFAAYGMKLLHDEYGDATYPHLQFGSGNAADIYIESLILDLTTENVCNIDPNAVTRIDISVQSQNVPPMDTFALQGFYSTNVINAAGGNASNYSIESFYREGDTIRWSTGGMNIGLEFQNGDKYLFRDVSKAAVSTNTRAESIVDWFSNFSTPPNGDVTALLMIAGDNSYFDGNSFVTTFDTPIMSNSAILIGNMLEAQRLQRAVANGAYTNGGMRVWYDTDNVPQPPDPY